VTAMANDTVLQWAGATNVGQVRSNNEDRYLARDDAGLWVVADGMGGHRGGEIASQIACEEIAQHFDNQTIEGLVDAIESANTAVYRVGADDPDLAGMGTTVVVLAVVDQGEQDVLAVANVGDSRAYRLDARGELEQLTEDHSLVADMVREGSISAEEAASHPQRNILTRVLGVYEDVPVDVLTVTPHRGDRFLLCSDGLFNEMPEDRIASVLRRLANPEEAVDELVRLALEAGGRDNVTVVLVDVLADGERAAVATSGSAAHHAGDTATQPIAHDGGAYASGGAYSATDDDTTTRSRWLRRSRQGDQGAGGLATDVGVDGDDTGDLDDLDDDRPRHRAESTGRQRRLTWRVALFTLLVLAVLGGAFATIQWYAGAAYFVGFAGDDVAIFHGRPGGVLWIEPELVERTQLTRDDVPADTVAAIQAGKQEESLSQAEDYVETLGERIDEIEAEQQVTTTTSTTAAQPPPTPPPGPQAAATNVPA
jgi:serine/threonine protein phosphatase PrpC